MIAAIPLQRDVGRDTYRVPFVDYLAAVDILVVAPLGWVFFATTRKPDVEIRPLGTGYPRTRVPSPSAPGPVR
jgi:hypothetical protein